MDIKPYKPIIIVYYKDIDGMIETLITEEKNLPVIRKTIENSKTVEIEGVVINCYMIQKICKPENSLEEIFYSQPKKLRVVLNKIARERGYRDWQDDRSRWNDPKTRLIKYIDHFYSDNFPHEKYS